MEGNNEKQLEVPPPYTEYSASDAGQSSMGQPPMGQPPMGQPPMGQPPMGQPYYNTYPVVQQPAVIIQTSLPLDRNPTSMNCPRCHANIVTDVTFKAGNRAWKFFGLMCCLGCWCGCCLIPWCSDGMKDADHHCPQCKGYIGRCTN